MISHNELSTIVKFIETETATVVTGGWREWEKGSCCFMGIEFQFCNMKKLWRLCLTLLNCTLQMVKKLNFVLYCHN